MSICEKIISECDIKSYLNNLRIEANEYEIRALELFDTAVSYKSQKENSLYNFINDPDKNIDIWALSTKCVTYPKPIDYYLIGNGNGNADDIIKNIMSEKEDERTLSFNKQLFYCVIKQNIKGIKALLKYGDTILNINYQDENTGFTALHIAISSHKMNVVNNNVKLINFLINNGASINIKDYIFERTPIHFAIYTMQSNIIACLIAHANSFQINTLDKKEMSPLCIYYDQLKELSDDTSHLQSEIENMLVDKGANYSLLRQHIQNLEIKLGTSRFAETKNKIYKSIEFDIEIIKQENSNFRNDLDDMQSENIELKKNINYLNDKIDELNETYENQKDVDDKKYKQKITELCKLLKFSQEKEIDLCKKNNIQENIIKLLSKKIEEYKSDYFYYDVNGHY
jgi:hypothetical protein